MKKSYYLATILLTCMELTACNPSENKEKNNTQVATSTSTQANQVEEYDSVYNVVWNENNYATELIMKDGGNLYVNLEITDDSKKIRARVVPDEPGLPIQIAYIIYPDGNKYGPFENTLDVDIKEKGKYQLMISQAKPINVVYNGTLKMEIQKR